MTNAQMTQTEFKAKFEALVIRHLDIISNFEFRHSNFPHAP